MENKTALKNMKALSIFVFLGILLTVEGYSIKRLDDTENNYLRDYIIDSPSARNEEIGRIIPNDHQMDPQSGFLGRGPCGRFLLGRDQFADPYNKELCDKATKQTAKNRALIKKLLKNPKLTTWQIEKLKFDLWNWGSTPYYPPSWATLDY